MSAKFTVAFVLLGLAGLCQCAQPPTAVISASESKAKKLLYFGWGSPNTYYVRDHWQQMEEMPFDGVGIVVPVDRRAWQGGKRGTGNQLGWQIMGKRAFRTEDFRAAAEDLKAAKWSKFSDNFLPVILSAAQSATKLNWFDDSRWRIIANNFEVLARIAADTGLKGLILDPEHYSYALFNYTDQRRQADMPFDAYTQKARQRGREVMTAIAAAMPKAVILSLIAYTYPLIYLKSSENLPKTPYNLLPAFYDGFLEAMPSEAILVDGYEQAYPFKEQRQFAGGYRRIQEAIKLSAVPEHYRKKVKVGFGLWLDYRNQANYFKPDEFQRAVSSALKVSDGYVWIYSQSVRFFPLSGIASSYIDAMAEARRQAMTNGK
jgi:hypothetical protein